MQTSLSPEFQGTPDGEEAQAIIRKCVHCGFCNATCPTYQLLGDELDGPRGRIYLIKQVLEGGEITRSTQQHLDRCLTCLNCQTTCPSGVEFGNLVDIGRKIVDARVQRPAGERAVRWLLKEGLTSRAFAPAMRLGSALRPVLPAMLKAKVPGRIPAPTPVPAPMPARAPIPAAALPDPNLASRRKVLLLRGCVQPAMRPSIDAAAARVLAAAGIETACAGGGCCGALRMHLGDQPGAAADMRRNIDAWTPAIPAEDAAIVASATACSLAIKGYGHALSGDVQYAAAAERISALAGTRALAQGKAAQRIRPARDAFALHIAARPEAEGRDRNSFARAGIRP
jgi:glycolate oxidase iron-sulfur subunit